MKFKIESQATMRDDAAALLMAQLDVVIRMVTTYADGVMLSEVVAGGPSHWRKIFGRAFRAGRSLPVHELDKLADMLFLLFSRVHVWRFGSTSPGAILDAVEETTPPTEKEIAAAWEIDSGSSEDGRRYFYGPDGSPEDMLRQLRDEPYTNTH
jgi:hypothetical protein